MTMNDRVHELRKNTLKMTMEDFGRRLGVTRAAISNIETGARSLTDQMVKSICREFHVSESWLRTGEGEMFVQRSRNEIVAEFVGHAMAGRPDSAKNWVISMLAEFSDDWWDEVDEVLKKIRAREIGPYAEEKKGTD